jgi:hypothetical protein
VKITQISATHSIMDADADKLAPMVIQLRDVQRTVTPTRFTSLLYASCAVHLFVT